MLETTATELPRLMNCIGSYYMPAELPQDINREAAEEGIAAHWLAKMRFDGSLVAVGQNAPNGHIITDEMSEYVDDYIKALDCGEMEIETSHYGSNGAWEIRGRADHIKFNPIPSVLTVDDFKYGHRYVPVIGNWTLLSHAIGWCIRNATRPDHIVFRIHQPRCYSAEGPIREWRITYFELMELYRQIDARLSNPVEMLTSGIEWCGKCHALTNCPAARQAAMNAVDASHVVFDERLPNNTLAWERETLVTAQETIENRLAALNELMMHKIKLGDTFHGYGLKPRYANKRWKHNIDGNALSALTGVDCVKAGTITPAEAKRRGVADAVINSLTERPVIGNKIERIDVDAIARKAFG